MKQSRRNAWLLFALLAAAAAWAWFVPVGTGEYADSPDGRYRAWATNCRRGTWFHGRVRYVDIKITERSSGSIVWQAERHPSAEETPPDFGDRSRKFVRWTPDSHAVSIPIGDRADSVWNVP